MQKILILLLSIFSLSNLSCSSGELKEHKKVSRDEMVEILSEIYLLEGARTLNLKGIGRDSSLTSEYYAKLYKSFNITPAEFEEVFAFYAENEEGMSSILNEVLENFSKTEINQ